MTEKGIDSRTIGLLGDLLDELQNLADQGIPLEDIRKHLGLDKSTDGPLYPKEGRVNSICHFCGKDIQLRRAKKFALKSGGYENAEIVDIWVHNPGFRRCGENTIATPPIGWEVDCELWLRAEGSQDKQS